MTLLAERQPPQRSSWLYDPRLRGLVLQAVLAILVVLLIVGATLNAIQHIRAAGLTAGFGFLQQEAKFDISQKPIPYDATSSYGRAFLVGLINTLIVGAAGVVLATVLGFVVGMARLSTNWLVGRVATVYVEFIRNVPLLLQLLFWYVLLIRPLPDVRGSLSLFGAFFLNKRGLFLPAVSLGDGGVGVIGLLVAVGLALGVNHWAARRQERTGTRPMVLPAIVALLVLLPLAAWWLAGGQVSVELPQATRFNLRGGIQIAPEFVALLVGLVIYTAAFIGEIVRAGVRAVSHGQVEAARAIGLPVGRTLRLVVVPQALRVIIPPLANQYLNLVKNSSLAVAIGYPDLVQLFGGTVLNQTGQPIECIAMTMAVYLVLSLLISAFMNWFNRRVALVER